MTLRVKTLTIFLALLLIAGASWLSLRATADSSSQDASPQPASTAPAPSDPAEPSPESNSEARKSPKPEASRTAAGQQTENGPAPTADPESEPSKASKKKATKSPKPAESFKDLTFDKDEVSEELVSDAVCNLNSGYFEAIALPDGTLSKRINYLRDSILIAEDSMAEWFLVEDLDPRIEAGMDLAREAVADWRIAVGYYDAADAANARAALVRADTKLDKLDKLENEALCPKG